MGMSQRLTDRTFMTLSMTASNVKKLSDEPGRPQVPAARGWAVVEIRPDGTLGPTEVVHAADPSHAAALARATAASRADRHVLTADLRTRLGLVQAAQGHFHEAHRTLVSALSLTTETDGQDDCFGQLALIEAFQGQLSRASVHADRALSTTADPASTAHARLAHAWVHLERAEFEKSEHSLEPLQELPIHGRDPWLEAARVLAEAKLLVATGRPDAAIGVLADGGDSTEISARSGWISGAMSAARAEALLASGEPQRALAAITPLPDPARVEASVAAAAVRRRIGDVRGASAVLGAVVSALEKSPLALQVRAWVLESRVAEDTGDHRRSWTLIDRALRSATSEQLRTPLRDDWRWLRAFLDREPGLMHRHRAFVAGLDSMGAPRSPQTSALLGTTLTQRECEVLELLAQMYSTEEIAHTLFVSANTVKTHVKGIFGKLCVNRRVDAVRKGRSMGLC